MYALSVEAPSRVLHGQRARIDSGVTHLVTRGTRESCLSHPGRLSEMGPKLQGQGVSSRPSGRRQLTNPSELGVGTCSLGFGFSWRVRPHYRRGLCNHSAPIIPMLQPAGENRNARPSKGQRTTHAPGTDSPIDNFQDGGSNPGIHRLYAPSTLGRVSPIPVAS
jgi:hypothetical protein